MWEHWNYGKWLIGVVLLQSLAVHGLTFMTTAMLGFGAVGILRAMQSFVLPFGHTMIALFAVAQPVLARDFGRGDFGALGRKSTALVAAVTCLALACEVGLLAFHRQLEYVLFSGKFAAYSGLIPVFGAAAIFEGLSASQALVLRAVQRPRLHMLSVAFTAPVALTIGFVLIRWGGVWGAAAATAATWAISAAAAHPFSRRWFRLRIAPVLLNAHPDPSSERGRNAHDREPNAVERAVDPA
jgi:O-antigen/teichoic acid export membrane protein